MFISFILLAVGVLLPGAQGNVSRDTTFPIPLKSGIQAGVDWGEIGRMADHAVVAINSEKDIAVAYHTDRYDEVPGGYSAGLKQVEVALFRYSAGPPEYWTHTTTELVGSIYADPHFQLNNKVKCERPDIIASGDKFFVTWTRRYDQSFGGDFLFEPAFLECAWIDWNGTAFEVHGSGTPGLGYELDRYYSSAVAFFVRDCAGVPDAVNLRDLEGPGTSTAGVVYPHQKQFTSDRLFDLRFATCTIDASHALSKVNVSPLLATDVQFKGGTLDSAGLILPDTAPGTTANRFWLIYEEQVGFNGGIPDGRIRLQFRERDVNGSWGTVPQASQTIGNGPTHMTYRRPNVSASMDSTIGEIANIAFNKATNQLDGDVVYEQWQYSSGGLLRVLWGPSNNYQNTTIDDVHPLPVLGASNPFFRRLLLDRNDITCKVIEFDPFGTPRETVIAESVYSLRRPAAAYLFEAGPPAQNYLPVTWEEKPSANAEFQVYLRIR